MVGSDLFVYNYVLRFTHYKDPSLFTRYFKYASNTINRGIASNKYSLQPFLQTLTQQPLFLPPPSDTPIIPDNTLDFFPLTSCLPSSLLDSDASAKDFRSACIAQFSTPQPFRHISDKLWRSFWALHLPATQRNVVYRFMLSKIPHLTFLNAIIPSSFPSPICRVCSSHNESLIHFLFLCPVKHLVWQNIIQEFLWPTCEANDIIHSLKTMDYSNIIYCKLPKISSRSITYITLAEIWKAHYRLVFQDAPLVLSKVLASIRQEIKRLQAENSLSSPRIS